jgi:hypothetical protein
MGFDPFRDDGLGLRVHLRGEQAFVGGAQSATDLSPHVHLDECELAYVEFEQSPGSARQETTLDASQLGHVPDVRRQGYPAVHSFLVDRQRGTRRLRVCKRADRNRDKAFKSFGCVVHVDPHSEQNLKVL